MTRIHTTPRVTRTFMGRVCPPQVKGCVVLFQLVLIAVGMVDFAASQIDRIQGTNSNENEALNFLRRNEFESSNVCTVVMETSWIYHTNITEFNRRQMVAAQIEAAEFRRRNWREAIEYQWRSFTNRGMRRLFSFATVLGSAALPADDRAEYARLLQDMKRIYAQTKVCPYDPVRDEQEPFRTRTRTSFPAEENDLSDFGIDEKDTLIRSQNFDDFDDINENDERFCTPTLKLDPDLIRIMAESRNPDELRYVWRSWRDAVGRPLKRRYLRFIRLSNKAAQLNGFNDTAEFWKNEYESRTLEEDVERIWDELKPLYEQLHAYVRKRLRDRYGETLFGSSGTIPAHILGNMWGQSWLNLLDITVPYPQRPTVDVTPAMKRQGFTPRRIYRRAEAFFTSLGFDPLPLSFWIGSMFEKPIDREVICHASAWDFCNGIDYRIKQCTETTMKHLITAHHEIGHIYYAMAYKDLPLLFRDGANPGFHEAIGDAIGLSVITPSYLTKIGLLSAETIAFEDDINFLFATALDKVAFLPFGLLVDKWRWSVMKGTTPSEEMNKYWWELKVTYQGISPPVFRSPQEFDPGSKYHIPANIPYIRYFIGYILQFQIYDELCRVSGHQGDLHRCDFYKSREAGARLRKLLRLGKSRPWSVVLSEFTDGRVNNLDARPMLRYFRKLNEWLIAQNRDETVGWSNSQALFALTGALVNTSSATFIGILVGACASLFLMGCLAVYCYRKFNDEADNRDSVAS